MRFPFWAGLAITVAGVHAQGPNLSIRSGADGHPILTLGSTDAILEFRDSLLSGEWRTLDGANLERLPGTAQAEFREVSPLGTTRFYRTRTSPAPSASRLAYDMGHPTVQDIWVDPLHGHDTASGATSASALASLSEAWQRIPQGINSSTGYHIKVLPGTLGWETMPNYWEGRRGTFQYPIIIEAIQGPGTVTLRRDINATGVSYFYLINFTIAPDPAGDTLHFESSDHLLIRGIVMNGGRWAEGSTAPVAHDNFKLNQCQYVYAEDCDVFGADDNAIDWVSVQYGHLVRTKAHQCNDWAAYAKGGSAYLVIEGNEFYDAGTGGFTAGQGTGFQFMVEPFLHYETYDFKIVNNFIHDVGGAGLGVNGGYNVLLAHNTVVRAGQRSHLMEFTFGNRSLDGFPGDDGYAEGFARARHFLEIGGWGTLAQSLNDNYARIPNRNIFVYNNLFWNPSGHAPDSQVFFIPPPFSGADQNGSNIPVPTRPDVNLIVKGNVIWNPRLDLPLGLDESALNPEQILADNRVNQTEPAFSNSTTLDFRPASGSPLASSAGLAIPDFTWTDAPARPAIPSGNNSNAVTRDAKGATRPPNSPPGAFLPAP